MGDTYGAILFSSSSFSMFAGAPNNSIKNTGAKKKKKGKKDAKREKTEGWGMQSDEVRKDSRKNERSQLSISVHW